MDTIASRSHTENLLRAWVRSISIVSPKIGKLMEGPMLREADRIAHERENSRD
jgi:hypothetical protein